VVQGLSASPFLGASLIREVREVNPQTQVVVVTTHDDPALAAEAFRCGAAAYLLKTCEVSDEKLGEMGKPYVMKYDGREVQLCCESCKKDFKKDPAKYMKKLDEAEKTAKK